MINSKNIFHFFKYLVYALLSYNAFLFFEGDMAASAQTVDGAVTWRNVIGAYAATIDTVAWVVLLLLFELETAVIPDHLLEGWLKWSMTALSLAAYCFIVYAFYGYCAKYAMLTDRGVFAIDDVCRLVGSDFTHVASLDDYQPFDAAACASMQGREWLRIAGTDIIGTPAALADATRLAIVDIVNAADWLVIVALLEIEVFLQLRNKLSRRMMATSKYVKGFFYAVLFVCAAYWGVKSTFLDFWDAFLWLVSFLFIELNVFKWNEETAQEKEHLMKV